MFCPMNALVDFDSSGPRTNSFILLLFIHDKNIYIVYINNNVVCVHSFCILR